MIDNMTDMTDSSKSAAAGRKAGAGSGWLRQGHQAPGARTNGQPTTTYTPAFGRSACTT